MRSTIPPDAHRFPLERGKIGGKDGVSEGQSPETPRTGCGAAWLARLTGGQEVGSSNLPSPTG